MFRVLLSWLLPQSGEPIHMVQSRDPLASRGQLDCPHGLAGKTLNMCWLWITQATGAGKVVRECHFSMDASLL